MKIVLDTTVLISALIKEGKPRELLYEILDGHELISSKEILEEVAIIANEPRVRKYVEQDDIADFFRNLASSGHIIKISSKFRAVKEDPDEDIILRIAGDGKASFVVSGDAHLLGMRKFRRIRIVTVIEMLLMLRNRAT